MLFKGFATFFVILFVVSLMILIFCLASLPEARFDLGENKAFDGEELQCSFTPSNAVVFSNQGNKTYTPPGSGFLRIVTGTDIKKNGGKEELVVKTLPLWKFVLFFYILIVFFSSVGIKEIFRKQ